MNIVVNGVTAGTSQENLIFTPTDFVYFQLLIDTIPL